MTDGRVIGSHWPETCPICGLVHGIQWVIADNPHREETHCGTCDRVLSINGRRVQPMSESVMAGDGEGRR